MSLQCIVQWYIAWLMASCPAAYVSIQLTEKKILRFVKLYNEIIVRFMINRANDICMWLISIRSIILSYVFRLF
jgi:hypothetical protein